MPKFTSLVKAVCGVQNKTLNGKPLPQSVVGWTPTVVAHDRRLSAGIFEKRRSRKAVPRYRIVVWRTYQDRKARQERATTTLFRDEIDPVIRLLVECAERLSREWA